MIMVISAKKAAYRVIFALILALIVILAIYFILTENRTMEPGLSSAEAPQLNVLIIDAGHGGEDGGASSKGGLLESGVNLSIALRVELLAQLYGIPSQMTRESEIIDYPESAKSTRQRKSFDQKSRIELINSIENGILISIHQNNFPDSRPSGTQVLYAKTAGSEQFAEITHENLRSVLCPESRRVASPISDSILLMRSVNCPAILVECAFLSNPREEALLNTDGYRLKIAGILMASYLQYSEKLQNI